MANFDYVVRKKMINLQLRDMSQLANSARQIEKLNTKKEKLKQNERGTKKESKCFPKKNEGFPKKKNDCFREKDMAKFVVVVEQDSDDESELGEEEPSRINLAELKSDPLYVCSGLKPLLVRKSSKFVKKIYYFDINKADQMFDILLKDKQQVLIDDHKIPQLNK